MSSLLRQMALLVAFGAAAAAVLNPLSPHPLALGTPVAPASASATATCGGEHAPEVKAHAHPMIPLSEAISACAGCTAAFVDARGEAAFAMGHVTNAIHLPPEGHPDSDTVMEKLRAYPEVIVYDADAEGGCRLAQGVADRLLSAGIKNVRVLEGSWTAWEAAQAPAQAGACAACAHTAETKP